MAGTKNGKDADLKAPVAPVELPDNDMSAGEAALTREQEEVLAGCAERLAALGRRSAVQTFEYGEVLAKAQAILPPKAFGKWLEPNCGIGTKAAKNYTRVYNELAPYRARLEKNAFSATAMFALLGAQPEQIEAVLDASDAGQRLTVQTIKELVGGRFKSEEPAEIDLLNLPGRAGC